MKANELRIRNLVTINNHLLSETEGEIYKVSGFQLRYDVDFPDSSGVISLDHTKSIRTYSQLDEFIEPIPLTEEWLLKFGFRKFSSCQFDRNDFWSFEMVLNNKKDGLFYCSHLELYFSFVHQLQNLYFALTGKELEIK